MKQHLLLLTAFLIFIGLNAQEFEWAWSYDIPNCNEVAALDVDDTGNTYSIGVFNAPYTLPFTGTAYIQKTDPNGQVIWTEYMDGLLQIGDLALTGNDPVIIGQSSAPFSYQGEVYGLNDYYMFILKINSAGQVEWIYTDTQKWGLNTNISVGSSGNMAFHIRGQSNQGDHVWVLDPEGNILQTKVISTSMTTIVDLHYYEEKVYLTGGLSGASGLTIDTIYIPQSPVHNATFVLALDENLLGEWVAIDTAINNPDGKVVVHSSGVYAYQNNFITGSGLTNHLKKFDFNGQLLKKVPAPVFSSGTLRPDLLVNDSAVALFVKNNNNSTSQKVAILGHALEVKAELLIEGPSNAYSGQIASNGNDLFVSNVHTGELFFDGGLIIPTANSDRKLFMSKVAMPSVTTSIDGNMNDPQEVMIYPNPANTSITVSNIKMTGGPLQMVIYNALGGIVHQDLISGEKLTLAVEHLPAGWYFITLKSGNGTYHYKPFVKSR
jgi:hypothetical protein